MKFHRDDDPRDFDTQDDERLEQEKPVDLSELIGDWPVAMPFEGGEE